MQIRSLDLDVIGDVICPWCWVGKRQLEGAKAILDGKLALNTVWKPFQLNPGLPHEGVDRRVYRKAKFGSLDYSAKLDARVAEAGRAVGLEFRHDRMTWTPNTFDAHRLIWLAGLEGAQDAVVEGLFRAYFSEGRNTGDMAVLIQIAEESGLNANDIGKRLAAGAGAAEVSEDLQRGLGAGVDSVPTIALGGRPLISGAVPAEQLAATLLKLDSR